MVCPNWRLLSRLHAIGETQTSPVRPLPCWSQVEVLSLAFSLAFSPIPAWKLLALSNWILNSLQSTDLFGNLFEVRPSPCRLCLRCWQPPMGRVSKVHYGGSPASIRKHSCLNAIPGLPGILDVAYNPRPNNPAANSVAGQEGSKEIADSPTEPDLHRHHVQHQLCFNNNQQRQTECFISI